MLVALILLSFTLRLSPLLEGPRWLPLHASLIIEDSTSTSTSSFMQVYDFVPESPSTVTLPSLLSPGVAAKIRVRQIVAIDALSLPGAPPHHVAKPQSDADFRLPLTKLIQVDSSTTIAQVDDHVESLRDKYTTLRLIDRNCYTFVFDILFRSVNSIS